MSDLTETITQTANEKPHVLGGGECWCYPRKKKVVDESADDVGPLDEYRGQ